MKITYSKYLVALRNCRIEKLLTKIRTSGDCLFANSRRSYNCSYDKESADVNGPAAHQRERLSAITMFDNKVL